MLCLVASLPTFHVTELSMVLNGEMFLNLERSFTIGTTFVRIFRMGTFLQAFVHAYDTWFASLRIYNMALICKGHVSCSIFNYIRNCDPQSFGLMRHRILLLSFCFCIYIILHSLNHRNKWNSWETHTYYIPYKK